MVMTMQQNTNFDEHSVKTELTIKGRESVEQHQFRRVLRENWIH